MKITNVAILFLNIYRRKKYKIERETIKVASEGLSLDENGVPQHFSLYYGMGTALVNEGVMSACYHVCPTQRNYQFGETVFAYHYMTLLCNELN